MAWAWFLRVLLNSSSFSEILRSISCLIWPERYLRSWRWVGLEVVMDDLGLLVHPQVRKRQLRK